jgi:WD40 repeat protein
LFLFLFFLASDLKDEEWETFTTTCRWGTQGVWSNQTRRHANSSDISKDGRLLAVVSENGNLEIFKHPCVDNGAQPVLVLAHSCHVTSVRFSSDGKYLFTVGGRDRLMMQWRVTNLS